MANETVTWLEEVLKAERRSVELTLATRHAALLKQLAPVLEKTKLSDMPTGNAAIVDTPESRHRQQQELLKETPPQNGTAWSGCLPWSASPPAPPEHEIVGIDAYERESKDENSQEAGHIVVRQASGAKGSAPPRTWRQKVGWFVDHEYFDYFIAAVIIANSICIGFETSWELKDKNTSAFEVLEHIFLVIYIIELSLRFIAHGKACFHMEWVLFDMVFVAVGVLSLYIIAPIANSQGNSDAKDGLAGLLVLRMLRLFRLAKVFRLMVTFQVLWKLVCGLTGSIRTICYTFALIVLILYIFACIALEIITKVHRDSENEAVHTVVNSAFPDLPTTILSLLQFVTIDSISGMYFPLIMEQPWLVIYFIPFILLVSVSLMNLVTAVIVEGALEQGAADAEVKRKETEKQFLKILPKLKAKFKDMDDNGNGLLTLDEILNAPHEIKDDLSQYVEGDDGLTELFEMIDTDESGEINCDEFCDGVAKLVHSQSPIELIRILKQLKIIRKDLNDLKSGNWITNASFAPQLSS
mmetsp:Transcript_68220/g.134806  ORF Transcript_68220/g.134806 Transcript_68220/m.134806 type:complete len:526 (-) Transcript_68220:223-1800(-)